MAETSARVRLRVVPGAGRDEVVGRHGEGWKVRVAAVPERDAANRAVVRLVSSALTVPERSVSVVSGHAAREKIIEIRGLAPPDVDRRLGATERERKRS